MTRSTDTSRTTVKTYQTDSFKTGDDVGMLRHAFEISG